MPIIFTNSNESQKQKGTITPYPFDLALDNDSNIKIWFFQLPAKLKINTPLGTYNPDWAVYLNQHGTQKFYFVIETKGTLNESTLRLKEKLKIHCCLEHFKALGNELDFKVASELEGVQD